MSTETILRIAIVQNWRTILLRGALSLAFGVVALLSPSITFTGLILLFSSYLLADGMLAFVIGVRKEGTELFLLLEGLVGVGVAIAALVWPDATIEFFVRVIAGWAVLTGILEAAAAIRLREIENGGHVMLIAASLISITLGILMTIWPATSAVAIVTFLGCYGFFFGSAMMALAFRMRANEVARHRREKRLDPHLAA